MNFARFVELYGTKGPTLILHALFNYPDNENIRKAAQAMVEDLESAAFEYIQGHLPPVHTYEEEWDNTNG